MEAYSRSETWIWQDKDMDHLTVSGEHTPEPFGAMKHQSALKTSGTRLLNRVEKTTSEYLTLIMHNRTSSIIWEDLFHLFSLLFKFKISIFFPCVGRTTIALPLLNFHYL